jgi:hypothetical protein
MRRFSKDSAFESDSGSDGSGSDSNGDVCGSVARVVKESECLGVWGLGGDETSGKVLESCRDDDGLVGISFSRSMFSSSR